MDFKIDKSTSYNTHLHSVSYYRKPGTRHSFKEHSILSQECIAKPEKAASFFQPPYGVSYCYDSHPLLLRCILMGVMRRVPLQ